MAKVKNKSGRKPLSPELVRTHEITFLLNDAEYKKYSELRHVFGNKFMASQIRLYIAEHHEVNIASCFR